MDKTTAFLPSVLLVAAMALLCVTPSIAASVPIVVAAALWGFHFYVSRPPPPGLEETRFAKFDQDLKDLTRQIDSLKTAVNVRQLR